MLIVCGQCRYRFDAAAIAPEGLACPRCARVIARPSTEEEQVAAEGDALSEEIVEAEEEGFAEVARQTAGRQVTVACGSCGKSLKVSARLAGKARRCPNCKAKILIPYPDDEEDAAFLKRAGLAEEEGLDLVGRSSSSHAPQDGAEGAEPAEGEMIAVVGGEPPQAGGPVEAGRGAVPRHHRPHHRPPSARDEKDSALGAIAAAAGQMQADVAPAVAPVAASRHGDSPGVAGTPVAIESSLAEAAKAAYVAPATVDLDTRRDRRMMKAAAALILCVCLAVVAVVASWHLIIRPSQPSVDDVSAGSEANRVAPGGASESSGTPVAVNTTPEPASTGGATEGPARSPGGTSTGGSTKTSIFTVPVLVPGVTEPRLSTASPSPIPSMAPSPSATVPPSPPESKCAVAQAVTDLFLSDGYCPAAPGQAYWKVEIDVTAGARALVVNPFAPRAGLTCPEGNFPCAGLLEPGTWPSQRAVRHPVSVPPGQTVKLKLLFDVPEDLTEAVLRLEGFSDTTVRPLAGPSGPGGTLSAGTYAEAPPRNLQPLLADPVMAAVQAASKLELTVAKNAEGYRLSLPGASVTGTASHAGSGTYEVHLQKGAASIEGKLRAATGGNLLILYLQDSPFHQITFARQGAESP